MKSPRMGREHAILVPWQLRIVTTPRSDLLRFRVGRAPKFGASLLQMCQHQLRDLGPVTAPLIDGLFEPPLARFF